MDKEQPASERKGGGFSGWGLLLAIPMMLLCCGGSLLAALLGAGALGAFWARDYGYLGLAVLLLAAGAAMLWRLRRGRHAAGCVPGERAEFRAPGKGSAGIHKMAEGRVGVAPSRGR